MNGAFQKFVREFKTILPDKIVKKIRLYLKSETVLKYFGFQVIEIWYKKKMLFSNFLPDGEGSNINLAASTLVYELQQYRNKKVKTALNEMTPISRRAVLLFVLLDKRTGKRTLRKLLDGEDYFLKSMILNDGLEEVYKFRFELEGIKYDKEKFELLKFLK